MIFDNATTVHYVVTALKHREFMSKTSLNSLIPISNEALRVTREPSDSEALRLKGLK